MRTEPFHETLEVDLDDDERNVRGRQAARQAQAIERYKAETKRLEDEWAATKKDRKTGEEQLVADLYKTARAAENGVEDREVLCEEVLVGVMVEVRRAEGPRKGEFVSSRPATKQELGEHEKPPMVPGGGAKRTKGKAKPPGPDDDEGSDAFAGPQH